MIKKAYCGAQWNGPAQGMIDPVKEVSAAEKRIQIGLSTRQKETVEMNGGDFEANVAQLARENELMKTAGLNQSTINMSKSVKKTKKQGENDDEDDENRKSDDIGDEDNE